MGKRFLSATLLALLIGDGALAASPASVATFVSPSDCQAPDASGLPRFGCASALNLRLMAADPRDLQRGSPLAPAAGDAALTAVERYRSGQAKSIDGNTTSPSAGASPAAMPTQETH